MATNNQKGANKRSNFVILTLQAGADSDGVKFGASGKAFASVRGFYSQGKDKQTDEFKPSMWFKVVGFADAAEEQPVAFIGSLAKGQKFTVKGRLGLEEWTSDEGEKRSTNVIFAKEIAAFEPEQAEADEEEPA